MTTVRYRGLHDDRGEDGGEEADFVLDSHRELLSLLARIWIEPDDRGWSAFE
jgi:hypothetical protein